MGIIDRGKIVAEGTPAQLKAEIGSPSVEVSPVDVGATDRLAELLAGFGTPTPGGRGSVTVQLPRGEAQLAEVVRALDQADLHVASLQLHQPSLDDVFLAKTGRKAGGNGRAPGRRSARTQLAQAGPSWTLSQPLRACSSRSPRWHAARSPGPCVSVRCSSSRCCSR